MTAQSETNDYAATATRMAKDVRDDVVEHPMATLLVVGVAAFAVGALWKSGHRPASRFDRLRSQIPDWESLSRYVPKEYLPRAFR